MRFKLSLVFQILANDGTQLDSCPLLIKLEFHWNLCPTNKRFGFNVLKSWLLKVAVNDSYQKIWGKHNFYFNSYLSLQIVVAFPFAFVFVFVYEYSMDVGGNQSFGSAAEEQMWGRMEPNWGRPVQTNWGRRSAADQRKKAVSLKQTNSAQRWELCLSLLHLTVKVAHVFHLLFLFAQTIMANSKVHLFAMIDMIFGPAEQEGI